MDRPGGNEREASKGGKGSISARGWRERCRSAWGAGARKQCGRIHTLVAYSKNLCKAPGPPR